MTADDNQTLIRTVDADDALTMRAIGIATARAECAVDAPTDDQAVAIAFLRLIDNTADACARQMASIAEWIRLVRHVRAELEHMFERYPGCLRYSDCQAGLGSLIAQIDAALPAERG